LNLVYQRVAINDESYLQDCLSSEHLAGIAASVPDPFLQWLDRVLSQREGSILPLILENSGPTLMQRFVLEKSVSTNTTASGGNTTLLAMADE
jgi:RHH-type proline utilization regulon transcriptional repressor/proline dehydrogenase/delta 1-pyrroline-5-carboxylate dehydrogenase